MFTTLNDELPAIWGSFPVETAIAAALSLATATVVKRAGSTYCTAFALGLYVLVCSASNVSPSPPDTFIVLGSAGTLGVTTGVMAWRLDGRLRELCFPLAGLLVSALMVSWGDRLWGVQGAAQTAALTWLLAADVAPIAIFWLWIRGRRDLKSIRAGTWTMTTIGAPVLPLLLLDGDWLRALPVVVILTVVWIIDHYAQTGWIYRQMDRLDQWISAEVGRVLTASSILGVAYPVWVTVMLNQHQPAVVRHVMFRLNREVVAASPMAVLAGAVASTVFIAMKAGNDKQRAAIVGSLGLPAVIWALAPAVTPVNLAGPARLIVMLAILTMGTIMLVNQDRRPTPRYRDAL